MDPILTTAQDFLRESSADLRSTIAGLEGDALDWTPAPETSSLAVLVAHATTAVRTRIEAVLTGRIDRGRYLNEVRVPAFATRGASAAEMEAMIDAMDAAIDRLSAAPDPLDYGALVTVEGEVAEPPDSVAWNVLTAVQHLREHVGHAQITRQLLNARG